MKKIQTLLWILILVVLPVGCKDTGQTIIPSGKTIKIGVIGPMSGRNQSLGEASMEGIETARMMHPYLKNGDAVQFIVEDDRNIPELAVKAFKKLVSKDRVAAIILLSTSNSALAVNTIADNYRVPVLVLLATHPEIGRNTKFVTQLCFDNIFQGKVAALFVRDELLLERVAVFTTTDNIYSKSLADEFIRKFRSLEGEIIASIPIPKNIADLEKRIARLKDQNIQLLYLPIAPKDVLAIARALQQTDWNPRIMGSDGLFATVFANHPEDIHLINNIFVIEPFTGSQKITPDLEKLSRFFKSHYATRHSTYPAAGYEGTSLLLNAMNRCQDPTKRNCINSRIRTTEDFPGLVGKITIQADGKALRPLIVNRIKDNQLQLVVKVY